MKKLPKEFYDQLKNVPADQVAIPFLTPTEKDEFIEQKINEDLYKVDLDQSYIVVQFFPDQDGSVRFEVQKSEHQSDWHMAKIYGYIMLKLVSRFKKKKND